MNKLLSFLLVFFSLQATAQKGIAVVYDYRHADDVSERLKLLVTVNDSVSFETTISSWSRKLKYKKPLGSGFQSHDMYLDPSRNLRLMQSHFESRKKYLVEDTIKKMNWTEAEGEREILGYTCKKAVAKDGDKIFIAWYAPMLPYSFGPGGIVGLPGLILELSTSRFHSTYKAVEVLPEYDLIIEPKEGHRIMADEYHKVLRGS